MENCFNGSCIANVDSNFIDCFDISIEWGRYVKTLLNSYLHVLQSFQILFVWSFSCHPLIVHSFGDVTISGEGLQSLTYTRHSCPLRSEGSLACHTYCDTASVYNGHLRGPVTLIDFGTGAIDTRFNDLGLSQPLFEPRYPACQAKALPPQHPSCFVCLGFIAPLENFSLMWRRHHYRWRTVFLTYARHSWPLSSKSSLALYSSRRP